MTTTAHPTTGAPTCQGSDLALAPSPATTPGRQPLFPPADADAEAYRAWLVASPWPEVVFASAGAR
ncbi:hypothetical protein [Arthrobacter sp. NEB 688]|uniref:hypothetical protein n=1 Tax=Arthrobacter sp. NEB 688 TaxID=904039 RepID=UPI001566391F|nr:hypothetical protein [Arthrobacter sp. NEB 688]QKE84953.1 hypothetical protein HL663_14050 [Arthrobacter sp. NEB 688]